MNKYHKKNITDQEVIKNFSSFSSQQTSQVRKILNELSFSKENPHKIDLATDSIFNLKLSGNDFMTKENRKSQIRSQMSPPKWKVSTNQNDQFSRNERVKGKILTGWDMQRANMSKRSYQQPKQYHGIKFDLFSREFPHDLSKTYSKGFNRKLKQIQLEYENKVFHGNIKTIQQKRQKSIDAIRSRGTKFQLSKDKLFGFTTPMKKSPSKINEFRSTISHFNENTEKKNLQ